jgi:hypothetical protein
METVDKTNPPDKCSFRGCRITGATKVKCAAIGCDKMVHIMCYQGLLLQKHKLHTLPVNFVCCTKICYSKIMTQNSGGGNDVEGMLSLPSLSLSQSYMGCYQSA